MGSIRLSDFAPGMIGLAVGDGCRTSDLLPSILALHKPPGTVFKKSTGLGPAVPFNDIGRAFMSRPELKWLFLTNDDNLCPPDTIIRLLTHNVDVVTGLYFSRIQPFEPILFDGMKHMSGSSYYTRKFLQPGDKGLIPITACGDGCLLIQRRVMEAIPDPWWEYGATLRDCCDHDIVFSQKVKRRGLQLMADLDCRVDHVTQMTVRPVRNSDGTWSAHLVQGEGRAIAISAPSQAGKYTKEGIR